MTKLAVIGATSAIAQSVARRLATSATHAILVGRNADRLEHVAEDLRCRCDSQVDTRIEDLNNFERHSALIQEIWTALSGCDVFIVAHGSLPDQVQCQVSAEETLNAFSTNALSVISLLTVVANKFAEQGSGSIVVISSVAGDRGRASNYVYGSAKAAVTAFASGLRNRLAGSGVHVLTIKPGLVDTPMTADFEKGVLWASPDRVAKAIIRALEKRRDVAYVPWYWRLIMLIICAIPERLFKRTKL